MPSSASASRAASSSCLLYTSKWLKDSNLPIMKLETSYEYSREATAPLATRIESFVESLKEGKK